MARLARGLFSPPGLILDAVESRILYNDNVFNSWAIWNAGGIILVDMRKWTVVGLLALVGSILLVPMASGQDSTVKVLAAWAPPSTEEFSEPVLYRIEIRFRVSKDAPKGFWGEVGTSKEPTYNLNLYRGMCYEVRVRAQDAAGLLGDYSVLSEEMCIPEGESQETATKDEPLPPDDIQGPFKQDE